jgi:hypothetical protein
MSWEIGFDHNWNRDIGYGVPADCDHPECSKGIDRGLAHVCGGEAYGGEHGCGLYFCSDHLRYKEIEGQLVQLCERCRSDRPPFPQKPDVGEWLYHKATDPSWAGWRAEQAARQEGPTP